MSVSLIWQKLKREFKTFAVAVVMTVVAGWQWAVDNGADVPSLFSWVHDQYKSLVYFGFGCLMLVLRKYTPTTVVVVQPQPPEPPPAPTVEPASTVEDK